MCDACYYVIGLRLSVHLYVCHRRSHDQQTMLDSDFMCQKCCQNITVESSHKQECQVQVRQVRIGYFDHNQKLCKIGTQLQQKVNRNWYVLSQMALNYSNTQLLSPFKKCFMKISSQKGYIVLAEYLPASGAWVFI